MKIHREDIISSFVVFIVALPLSLGIAMASGVSPAAGLITAILGGFLCGLFSGAPRVVAGPAAGLSAIIFQIVNEHGVKGLAVITVLAGMMQLSFGVFKLGKFFTYVPKSVLEGMLSVIGFIIAVYQLHVLFGSSVPKSIGQALTSMPQALLGAYWPIILCGAVAIAIQLAWPKMPLSLAWIPGALPAVIIATLLSLVWQMPRVEISDFVGSISSSMQGFSFSYAASLMPTVFVTALGLAVVASAETLLTAIALDNLARPSKTKANLNKELLAHGFTNAVSGLLGGIPVTGVIVRSAVNVNAGAKTRLSTVLHGIWIAVFVLLAPGVLQKIPLTALAAVLVVTGLKLLNVSEFKRVIKHSRWHGALWAITFIGILATDLLTGLCIAVSVFFLGEFGYKFLYKSRIREILSSAETMYFEEQSTPIKHRAKAAKADYIEPEQQMH